MNWWRSVCKFKSLVYTHNFLRFLSCVSCLYPETHTTQLLPIKSKTNSPMNLPVPVTTPTSFSHRQPPLPTSFRSSPLLAAWQGGLHTRLCVLVAFQLPRQQFLVLRKFALPFSAFRYLQCGGRQPGWELPENSKGINAMIMAEEHHPRSWVNFVYCDSFRWYVWIHCHCILKGAKENSP